MAGKKKVVASVLAGLNVALFGSIVTATRAGSVVYISQADGLPLMNAVPPLITVNTTQLDANGNAAAQATPEGLAAFDSYTASQANPNANQSGSANATAGKTAFNIVMAAIPTVTRGGGRGGVPKYPFDDMPAPDANGNAASFFVPATAEQPNPAKSLASTASSATKKYAVKDATTPTIQVERGKRGPDGKVLKGADGKIIKETVTVDNLIPTRVFTTRAVKDGTPWGFPAQAGAAIYREK